MSPFFLFFFLFFFLKFFLMFYYYIRTYQFRTPNYTTLPAHISFFLFFSLSFFILFFLLTFYYYIRIYQFRTPIQLYNSLFSLYAKVKVLNPKSLCFLIYTGTPKPRSSRRCHHGSLPLHRFLLASPSSLNPAHHILCWKIILR